MHSHSSAFLSKLVKSEDGSFKLEMTKPKPETLSWRSLLVKGESDLMCRDR